MKILESAYQIVGNKYSYSFMIGQSEMPRASA